MEAETRIGRTPEVSDEQIIEVGLKLESEGSRISAWKLRSVIGAGTPARLMKVWENYKAANGELVIAPEKKENSALPPEVEDNLRLMLGQLNESIEGLAFQTNNAAVMAADKRVKSEYEASKNAKEEAEQELAEAANTVAQLDSSIVQLNESLQVKENDIRDLGGKFESEKTKTSSLQEQLNNSSTKLDNLGSKHEDLKKEFTTIQVSAKTAEQDVKRLTEDVLDGLKTIDETSAELKIVSKDNIKLSTKLESANELSSSQKIEIEKLRAKNEALNESVGKANEKSQAASNAMIGYKGKMKEYEKMINDLKASIELAAKDNKK